MKKPAVLLIDDDPPQLRIYGWGVQQASDIAEAKERGPAA
jgi:hypothetical protein